MKRLWTSYYSATRLLPSDWMQVRISRTAPKWWHPERPGWVPELAPNDAVWAVRWDSRWEERYEEQLDALRQSGAIAAIIDRLPENAVLLCWEKDHIGCHRTALATY